VDWGRRRIGLAVCDALGITVRGLPTLVVADDDDAVAAVAHALAAEEVERVVVGVALREDGTDSERGAQARRFGERLAAATGLPVEFHDEGLTTWEAEEYLRERGRPLRKARAAGGSTGRRPPPSFAPGSASARGSRPSPRPPPGFSGGRRGGVRTLGRF
jgi:putative Holliday junction resolvase